MGQTDFKPKLNEKRLGRPAAQTISCARVCVFDLTTASVLAPAEIGVPPRGWAEGEGKKRRALRSDVSPAVGESLWRKLIYCGWLAWDSSHPFCLSPSVSVCLCLSRSVSVSLCLCLFLSVFLSGSVRLYLSVSVSLSLSFSLSLSVSLCVSVCLSVSLSLSQGLCTVTEQTAMVAVG